MCEHDGRRVGDVGSPLHCTNVGNAAKAALAIAPHKRDAYISVTQFTKENRSKMCLVIHLVYYIIAVTHTAHFTFPCDHHRTHMCQPAHQPKKKPHPTPAGRTFAPSTSYFDRARKIETKSNPARNAIFDAMRPLINRACGECVAISIELVGGGGVCRWINCPNK